MVAAAALGTSFIAKADMSLFGNSLSGSDGFNISAYNGQSLSGGAIEFTPLQNMNLSSVTLWLSGYTGVYGQSIYANIWLSSGANVPYAPYIGLGTTAHNDGSLAAFTFSSLSANPYYDPSGSMVLSANTSYWLVVTAQGRSGNYISGANWVGGTTPTGVAVLNGADSYNVSGSSYTASATLPAFSINGPSSLFIQEVPEPSTVALMIIPAALGIGRKLYQNRKARS